MHAYQRVGRLSMLGWRGRAIYIYAILFQKPYNTATNPLKAYLSTQPSSSRVLKFSKAHIRLPKSVARFLQTRVAKPLPGPGQKVMRNPVNTAYVGAADCYTIASFPGPCPPSRIRYTGPYSSSSDGGRGGGGTKLSATLFLKHTPDS